MGITATALATYALVDSNRTAKASAKASRNAAIASARSAGVAEAKENARLQDAQNATAKEAENVDIEDAKELSRKKRGVNSTYTAAGGSGAGMMKGTSLSPIGGGDTGAIAAV